LLHVASNTESSEIPTPPPSKNFIPITDYYRVQKTNQTPLPFRPNSNTYNLVPRTPVNLVKTATRHNRTVQSTDSDGIVPIAYFDKVTAGSARLHKRSLNDVVAIPGDNDIAPAAARYDVVAIARDQRVI